MNPNTLRCTLLYPLVVLLVGLTAFKAPHTEGSIVDEVLNGFPTHIRHRPPIPLDCITNFWFFGATRFSVHELHIVRLFVFLLLLMFLSSHHFNLLISYFCPFMMGYVFLIFCPNYFGFIYKLL